MLENILNGLSGALSYLPNQLLNNIPNPAFRPFVIFVLCLIGGIFSVPKMFRFRWARIIFLTIVYYLALSAVGVK